MCVCARACERERERVEETSCGWFLYIDDACKTNISVEGDCQAAICFLCHGIYKYLLHISFTFLLKGFFSLGLLKLLEVG